MDEKTVMAQHQPEAKRKKRNFDVDKWRYEENYTWDHGELDGEKMRQRKEPKEYSRPLPETGKKDRFND